MGFISNEGDALDLMNFRVWFFWNVLLWVGHCFNRSPIRSLSRAW